MESVAEDRQSRKCADEAENAEEVGPAPRPSKAWGIIPISMVRDERFTAAHLVVLAYRVTYADDRTGAAIVPVAIGRIVRGRGLGRDVVEHVIADLKRWGILQREQPPPNRHADGTYWSQHAVDVLTL